MKIVYIITDLAIGGAQMMLYKLLSKMSRERFTPVVVSLMDNGTVGDRLEALGIAVYAIGMKQGKPTPGSIWRLVRLVRQLQPDLIQGWMYHGNLAAQLASTFCSKKTPVLWSIHNSIYSLAYEKRMTAAVIKAGAHLSKLPAKIVFVSQISQSQHQALGYCSEKSCIIPNGFDSSLFIPSSEANLSIRSDLSLPEKSFLIGLVARFDPLKDHENFLRAASILSRNYPDVHFLLVGLGVDRENQILNQLIQELGLRVQTHLLGERKDMPRITAALDIACSSSYSEAFPIAIGEAMSCGVPCVVTDVGDSAIIVGDTGRVVPPRKPDLLANAWKEIIELSLEDRKALGNAARNRILDCFSLASIVVKYEALYESLLDNKISQT
jgi:glycosyltransferase involved in cell wall biosynthesis